MSKKNLYKALFEIKKELGTTIQASAEGQYGSYVPLEAVMGAIEPLLVKYGILLIQGPMVVNGQPMLTTQLVHVESEESDSWFQILVTDKPGPQGLGAAETYARRRNLMAIFGLAVGEDDPDAGKNHNLGSGLSMADIQRMNNVSGTHASVSHAPKRHSASQETDLERKIIRVGKKFKGLRYGQCSLDELDNYGAWLRRTAAEKNESMNDLALEFCEDVEALKQMLTGFAPSDSNIPF